MALVPWRRRENRGLFDLQQRINTMFDDLTRGFPLARWVEEDVMEWVPALDVSETDDAIEVQTELPGVDPDHVDVSLSGDLLTIRGEKKSESEEKKRDYHRIERSYGSFSRTVRVPSSVDPDKVEASYKDGVLTVTMPKREEAKAQTVKIKVK